MSRWNRTGEHRRQRHCHVAIGRAFGNRNVADINPALASFLIGQAIRKQLDAGGHDAETLEHIEAVFGWLHKWMPHDDMHCVSLSIGYMINGDFDGEVPSIMGHSSLYQKPPTNDEVPEFRGDIFLVTEPTKRPPHVRKPPKPDGKRP